VDSLKRTLWHGIVVCQIIVLMVRPKFMEYIILGQVFVLDLRIYLIPVKGQMMYVLDRLRVAYILMTSVRNRQPRVVVLVRIPVLAVLGLTKGVEEILAHPTKCIKPEVVPLMGVILNHAV
jgi:hypothetical protein